MRKFYIRALYKYILIHFVKYFREVGVNPKDPIGNLKKSLVGIQKFYTENFKEPYNQTRYIHIIPD